MKSIFVACCILFLVPIAAYAQAVPPAQAPQPDMQTYAQVLFNKSIKLMDEASSAEAQVQMLLKENADLKAQLAAKNAPPPMADTKDK